jgi:hypothetical protein
MKERIWNDAMYQEVLEKYAKASFTKIKDKR